MSSAGASTGSPNAQKGRNRKRNRGRQPVARIQPSDAQLVGSSQPANDPQPANQGQQSTGHIRAFFALYPTFPYDPSAPIMVQFYAMCKHLGWHESNPEKDAARETLKIAMVMEFNSLYGTDENNIESWKDLCRILNVFPVPDELIACRDAVKAVHVNIVDLVDSKGTGPVQIFPSERALSQYTKDTGKYFPKEDAYAGGILKFLLRRILFPRAEGGRQGIQGGQRGHGGGTR